MQFSLAAQLPIIVHQYHYELIKNKSINPSPLLEIACFNISSAITAVQAGADRIELCDNPADGGTTPSFGTIRLALEKIPVPVFPIIRPRGGDFLHNDDEYKVMLHDVLLCKQLNCKGIVVGLLQQDGSVDVRRTTELVQAAAPMQVTFHRAFDRAANPSQALEDIITTGCNRLLTSGQKPYAADGKQLIQQLIVQAANRIIIMPGSGLRSHNIAKIAEYTGAVEFHSSARIDLPSPMQFVVKEMEEEQRIISVDAAEIAAMKRILIDRNS